MNVSVKTTLIFALDKMFQPWMLHCYAFHAVDSELACLFLTLQLGDRLKFVFSPDLMLCGWQGSKHKPTNKQTILYCKKKKKTHQKQANTKKQPYVEESQSTGMPMYCRLCFTKIHIIWIVTAVWWYCDLEMWPWSLGVVRMVKAYKVLILCRIWHVSPLEC